LLEHRIKCGDSLVGVFPLEVLNKGIPDSAFNPLSDDDESWAESARRINREERYQYKIPFDAEMAETRGIKQKQARNSPTNPGGEMHLRWVFSPSWKMKLAFLVLFSLLFLMIGYLTTDLLMNLFEG